MAGSSPSLPDGSNPSAAIVQSASDVQCSRLLKTTETSPNLRWSVVQVSNPGQGLTPSEQLGKIRMDPTFVREMLSAMDVGSTLVITDWASTRDTHSDSDFTVIATETPNNPTKSLKK